MTFTLEDVGGQKILSVSGRPVVSVPLEALRGNSEARAAWATLIGAALLAEQEMQNDLKNRP